jgi:DNA-directed RNA polymerase subunit RPC12/RpoP
MAPRAVCSRCGAVYRGWALLDMAVAECRECGAKLDIELRPPDREPTSQELVRTADAHHCEPQAASR